MNEPKLLARYRGKESIDIIEHEARDSLPDEAPAALYDDIGIGPLSLHGWFDE